MAVSRKDFIHTAEQIARADDAKLREIMVVTAVEVFTKANPRFDRQRFIEYIAKERAKLGATKFGAE